MQNPLVVIRAFGSHAIGDLIAVPADISETLASEHASYVVQMVAPVPPAAARLQPEI